MNAIDSLTQKGPTIFVYNIVVRKCSVYDFVRKNKNKNIGINMWNVDDHHNIRYLHSLLLCNLCPYYCN